MPQSKFQRLVFAFLTVIITVHAFVFYSLRVVNGDVLMAVTGQSTVIGAIRAQGGVYMFGRMCPIWAVVLVEFVLAFALENFFGSPCSFRLARRVFDPAKNHPMMFESAIICATVGLMCPVMSFIAAWLYYPYYEGFNFITLLVNWFKLVCCNLPFAYFSQMFFIQPAVRRLFKLLFIRQIKAREAAHSEAAARGEVLKAQNESEAIADIWKRINELDADIGHEHRKRKELESKVSQA